MCNVEKVLRRQAPRRVVYAPNYWQWFSHHRNHGTLPEEISHCESQLEVINYLGLDVFSRNIYCNEQKSWFGGLSERQFDGIEYIESESIDGRDRLTEKVYKTSKGELFETLRYVFDESTLTQEKFMVDDYERQLDVLEEIIAGSRWKFLPEEYKKQQERVAPDGVVIAGELFSPLKMLHLLAGPTDTTYLIMDYPEYVDNILKLHEEAQLDLVRQMAEAGVPAMMSMDNLDTMFHSPAYVEKYSASFYEKASNICHEHGATFFIHACGQQKDNLKLISSLGVDGLEGVAYPPLGDVDLDVAMELTNGNFIITGGISAMETRDLKTREQVFEYVENLFGRMRPYTHRFMFSASCNTAINTSWETIKWFRDAWLEYA